MKNNLVGDTSVELAGVLGDIMAKYRGGHISLEHLKRFAGMEANPFAVRAKDAKREIEKFAAKTARKLSTVFKKRIVVDPLPPEFTDENLAHWASFNFRPVFLPREDIGANRPLKNWTKPEGWFYERVDDVTISADYIDGSQVFVNDPLEPIIADLRSKKLAGKHNNTPDGSRFSITPNEWQDVVLAHVAFKLGVTRAQTRLERAVEFNTIGNLYDPNRGKFNAWEWFEDYFGGSRRLYGGDRGGGGLADVSYGWSGLRYDFVAARPLVSFVL